MKVLATAGHVDHGKSTLVRALTGMEPDRWAEERRRGMTIDLGYAWTALDPHRPAEQLAIVDVPGHQRFLTNMLAGVGPVPAVLLVIAADAGWARQTSEHLDAIEALGIGHGVVALTRADLATPDQLATVTEDVRHRLASTALASVPVIAVSGLTGAGLSALRSALRDLLAEMPAPRTEGRVRLWLDRCFTVKGAGTVVTGTLGSGRISVGDELQLHDRRHVVRGVQQLGQPVRTAEAVARVALNLRGLDHADVSRGDCLLTPGTWRHTDTVDVLLSPLLAEPATQLTLHLGSASVPVHVRMLGEMAARLTLGARCPLEVGDRGVLRDPGQQTVVAGVEVLDPDPPALTRRGAARHRGTELTDGTATGVAAQVHRRGAVRQKVLADLGFAVTPTPGVLTRSGWLVSEPAWTDWLAVLERAVDDQAAADPLRPWLTEEAARRTLGIADPSVVGALATEAGLALGQGRIGRPDARPALGASGPALGSVLRRLRANPFDAPARDELTELGLGTRELAAAERAGQLIRLAPDLVVAADAITRARESLAALPQPFTTSQARQALCTTRRIAVPLLEHLDRMGITVRGEEDARWMSPATASAG